jgi:phosphate starvation-inducible PhoH-like protein
VAKHTDEIKPKNDAQKRFMGLLSTSIEDMPLIITKGPAGTGKTLLIVNDAVQKLKEGKVQRIVISRPAVACEELGFLPGDAAAKIEPFLVPIFDAFDEVAPQVWEQWQANEQIMVVPIAFMRGRTFKNAYIIIDEVQNVKQDLFKMIVTRIGEGSRMVVDGDVQQIDLPKKADSAAHILPIFENHEDMGIGTFEFKESDSVRSKICKNVLKIYQNHESRRQ